MCRLYAMHANEPTRVECGLVQSQNALMKQSRADLTGMMHGHGWGVADYPEGVPKIEKQTWAAFHGEHFSKAAARVYAKTVVAHVRRATVGGTSLQNTHPFQHGRWIFAHNGTVPGFERVRFLMLDHIDPLHRAEIRGETDSEHVFRYLMSLFLRHPEKGLLATVKHGLEQVVAWAREVAPDKPVGLNIVLTDGDRLVGARLNRTLSFIRRDHRFKCPICGKPHVLHDPGTRYRAIEVASEPVTQEPEWAEVPNGVVYRATRDFDLSWVPLDL
ncbi:class II glutamine amidotransferase [Maribius pontilimi]|uniref:Class II glutamine amidotransferase n=1 Tax=Palleronia pontilimi TaxID=1964209 RepID=A0A934MHX3_9RHOB|nr:class II glutamine amidotransferase [Palleronia pontilimi]MBJ3763714.1 class II glutamine amidotransferase [Palleronia pontilimi]